MRLPDYNEAKNRNKVEINYLDVSKIYEPIYQGKKYFLRTYGCQMNVHDSEQIRFYLESLGFAESDTLEEADIVVLNTCAIRENAEQKVFGKIGNLKSIKAKRDDMIICICGCKAQEESVVEKIMAKHPLVDLVFGRHNIHRLQQLFRFPEESD